MTVELGLDDDGPDINAEVQENNRKEAQLSATALANALQVENKAQTEAANNTEEGRYQGGKSTGANTEVCCEISRPGTASRPSANSSSRKMSNID